MILSPCQPQCQRSHVSSGGRHVAAHESDPATQWDPKCRWFIPAYTGACGSLVGGPLADGPRERQVQFEAGHLDLFDALPSLSYCRA